MKQLSFSYTQYPSASHTRLSHSLGAAKNAELALRGIFSRGVYYEVGGDAPVKFSPEITDRRDEIIQRAKLAALLHDLGHGPFGHALDHYVGFCDVASSQPRPDKKYTAAYIKEYLAPTLQSLGFEPTQLLSILDPSRAELTGIDNLIADIVDSSLDVDRMDYLLRDAHMTGLQMGVTNTPALIDAMRPVKEADTFLLTYDEDAERYIEHFLFARDMMFFNCYEQPRKKAAERIFTRLVKSLHEDSSLGLDLEDLVALSDEEVLVTLRAVGSGSDVRNNLLEQLLGDCNSRVVHAVRLRANPEELSQTVTRWYESTLEGRPADLKTAYILQPEIWEEAISANSIGKERSWQIHVLVPAYEVYLQHHSSTQLLCREPGGTFRTEKFFDRSWAIKQVLEHMNSQRAVIKVLCPAQLPEAEQEQIKQSAQQELGC